MRQDEFDCEDAAARLEACCPGFNPGSISCVYAPGCNPSAPQIDLADSQCIRAASCGELMVTGVCDRVERLAALVAADAGAPLCGPDAVSIPPDVGPGLDDGSGPGIGITVQCLGSDDCSHGQQCCGQTLVAQSIQSFCSDAPCGTGQLQLCASGAECGVGQACTNIAAGTRLFACQERADAVGSSDEVDATLLGSADP